MHTLADASGCATDDVDPIKLVSLSTNQSPLILKRWWNIMLQSGKPLVRASTNTEIFKFSTYYLDYDMQETLNINVLGVDKLIL